MNNDYIELLIKVPEEIYKHTQEYEIGGFNAENDSTLFMAIKNGTPLPKGHDALIDRKNVIDVIDWYRLNPQHFSIDNVIDDIKCMECLVGADKEGEQ